MGQPQVRLVLVRVGEDRAAGGADRQERGRRIRRHVVKHRLPGDVRRRPGHRRPFQEGAEVAGAADHRRGVPGLHGDLRRLRRRLGVGRPEGGFQRFNRHRRLAPRVPVPGGHDQRAGYDGLRRHRPRLGAERPRDDVHPQVRPHVGAGLLRVVPAVDSAAAD